MPRLENNVEKLETRNTDVNKVLHWRHTVPSNPSRSIIYGQSINIGQIQKCIYL